MKFLSCHVENFGKLRNFDYDFSDGLSEILQENGWGKTTFAVFLKAMLYGMSKKGNNKAYVAERSRYMPWHGGVYGGTITFEHKGNRYKMYRTFGTTPERDMFSLIDLQTNKKTNIFTENIGYEIYGVGRETFEVTTYFPQMTIDGKITDEMRASLSGVNNLQNDLKNFSKAIDGVDNKVKLIKKEIALLSNSEAVIVDIAKLEKQIETEENNILKLQDDIELLNEKRETLKEKYEKAHHDQELLEIGKKEINDIKEQLISKKSDLLAFQLKLQELEKENLKRGLRNKYILASRKTKNIVYYGSIVLFMALITLLAFEFIYGAMIVFKYLTIAAMVALIILIVYCYRANKNSGAVFNKKLELETYQKQIENLKIDVKKLQEILDAKQTNQEFPSIENKKDLRIIEDFSACEKEILQKKMQISLLQKNIENFEVEKENLTSEQILKDEKKLELQEKIKLLGYVKNLMNVAKTNVSARYMAPMQEKFTKLVEQIVLEGAGQYVLDTDLKVSVENPTGNKEMEYLSQGYRDLMNICRRFSLIDSIFEKEKPIIILDDPFVNLDDTITKNALKLIRNLSANYQIIHLYCHSSRKIKKNS